MVADHFGGWGTRYSIGLGSVLGSSRLSLQHRNDDERNGDSRGVRASGDDRSSKSAEKRLDEVRQRGLTNPAQSKRRNGDVQLGRRKIGVEIIDGPGAPQRWCGPRRPVVRFGFAGRPRERIQR